MVGAGFVRASSGVALSRDQALVELAKAARDMLLEVAATYRATITYHQLGVDLQRRAGIRAGTTPGWLADTLAMVVHVGHRLAEPALTSLVVGEDGQVGVAFDEVRANEGLPPFADAEARELAAAASRLDCYRRYAPGVPADAQPTLVSADAAKRTPSLRSARPTRATGAGGSAKPVRAARPAAPLRTRRDPEVNRAPFVLCPSCFIQTPPGAECQNCGSSLA